MTFPTNATPYATDEDVILRASADFVQLCPRDQCLAWGIDGEFAADDLWTLHSASVSFLDHGVSPGTVVRLIQPIGVYRPPGDGFIVASVSSNTIGLRRKGQLPGVGQPASPVGGLTNVEFVVTTLGPQIAIASDDLNRRFGIEDLILSNTTGALFDLNELKDATVLTTLYRQYLEMSRGPEERVDTFIAKSQRYKQELDDLLSRLVIRWAPTAGGSDRSESLTRMNTRLSR